jgi:hypothetical protein
VTDSFDPVAYNRAAWDREVENSNEWTQPAGPEVIARARAGAEVLCLASGGGQQGPVLSAAGAAVTVLDNSPRQLGRDREVATREGLAVRTVLGDMRDLSVFPDASFTRTPPPGTCLVTSPPGPSSRNRCTTGERPSPPTFRCQTRPVTSAEVLIPRGSTTFPEHDGSRSKRRLLDAVVGAAGAGTASAGAVAGEHLQGRAAVQLDQVALGAAPLEPGGTEVSPEPIRPDVHPALPATAGYCLVRGLGLGPSECPSFGADASLSKPSGPGEMIRTARELAGAPVAG